MAPGQTTVKHGSYGMNGNSKGDRQIHKEVNPLGRFHLLFLSSKNDPTAKNVQEKITIQYDGIIEQHGIRAGMKNNV